MTRWVWLLAALLTAPAGASTAAAPFLWQVRASAEHTATTHYLVGSIHLLPETAQPLPEALSRAYAASERLVFESDISALASPALQSQMLAAARDTPKDGLRGEVPASVYRRLVEQLPRMQLPANTCDAVRAWFCALMLEMATYQSAGFSADYGVDRQFHDRAKRDGKRMAWLESPQLQLELFTDMPPSLGRSFLASALDGLEDARLSPQQLLRAWQQGDIDYLAERVEQMREEYPLSHARLLADRNDAWRAPLESLLRERVPTLVIVGAAHLVGADGVIEALRADGFSVTAVGN